MKANLINAKAPDFNTPSGIMDHFNRVPFETFKKDINEWFMTELPDKRPDLFNTVGQPGLPAGFTNFVEQFFNLAREVDNTDKLKII